MLWGSRFFTNCSSWLIGVLAKHVARCFRRLQGTHWAHYTSYSGQKRLFVKIKELFQLVRWEWQLRKRIIFEIRGNIVSCWHNLPRSPMPYVQLSLIHRSSPQMCSSTRKAWGLWGSVCACASKCWLISSTAVTRWVIKSGCVARVWSRLESALLYLTPTANFFLRDGAKPSPWLSPPCSIHSTGRFSSRQS